MKNRVFVHKLVGTAILAAVVISLQLLLGSIKFGPFNITFTLIPIILGAILYGAFSAAFLGLMVCFSVISGNDAGGYILFSQRPVITLLLCLIKSSLAGYLAGLSVRLIKTKPLNILLPAVLAPVVNTGTFILGLLLFFQDTLALWAGGQDSVLHFLLFGILGANFLIELLVNLLISPIILRILQGIHFTREEVENI